MKAEIIAVGTEILTGQIVNTNAQFLSEKCAELGIDVYFQTAVGDNEARLLSTIEIASKRSDIVILCGGLGPTEDDLTKQTLAKFLGKALVFDASAMKKLDQFFASKPGRIRTPNNERQAQIIEGSQPLQNPTGLAVGGMIHQDNVTYIVLPGPPSELRAMFTKSLQPLLVHTGKKLYSRVLRFFGIGESQLVTVLKDIIDNQTDPTVAPYAKTGEVTLRLSTKASSDIQASKKLNQMEAKILSHAHLSDYLYGYGEESSLAKVVGNQLAEKGYSLAISEEFTGGLLQSEFTANLQEISCFKGGRILASGTKTEAQIEANTVRMESGATIGLSLLAKSIGSNQIRLEIGVSMGDQTEVFSIVQGGHSAAQLRQIACLNAFNCIRQIL